MPRIQIINPQTNIQVVTAMGEKKQNKFKKFVSIHPYETVAIATVVSGAIGGVLGKTMPFSENQFIQQSLNSKADAILLEAHNSLDLYTNLGEANNKKINEELLTVAKKTLGEKQVNAKVTHANLRNMLVENISEKLVDVRKLLSVDIFNKVTLDFPEEKMFKKAKSIPQITADKHIALIKSEFSELHKNWKENKITLSDEMKNVVKFITTNNAKVGILTFAFTAFVASSLLTFNHKKNKQ